jgi:PAS domain S-box-containing protein
LLIALAITIASEMSFTLYTDVYGAANAAGHFLKIISFYLVYKAIIEIGITQPNAIMFKRLKDSEGNFRDLYENAPNAYFSVGTDGLISNCNRKAGELLGLSVEELTGRQLIDTFAGTPDDQNKAVKVFRQIQDGNNVTNEELQIRRRDGTPVWISLTAKAILDTQGRIIESRFIILDITERKKLDDALKKSEEKYRTLFENMLDGYSFCKILVDEENKPIDFLYIDVNDAFERLTGLKKKDVIGKKVTEAIPTIKDSNPELIDIYGEVALTGKSTAFEVFFKPLVIWLHISVYSPQKDYFVAVFDNITERKQAQEKIQESEAKFRSIIENSSDQIFMLDKDYKFLSINKTAADIFRKSPQEMIDKSIFEIFPEDTVERFSKNIKNVFDTGKSMNIEEKMLVRGREFDNSTSLNPVLDHGGRVIAVAGIVRDITERKQAEEVMKKKASELEKLNIRLQDLDRLKSVFLASMSHELRTPLNSIIGFTSLIIDGMVGEINEEQRKQLTIVKSSSNHLLSMINDILDIAKIEAGKVELSLEEFGLENEITEVIELFSPIADLKGIEILRDTTEGITLFSDKRRLKQVLINLISNAVKFTDRGSVKLIARVMGDDTLEVKVVDTGIGITAEDISKLFAPFQQVDSALTKKHEGTGLGLHLSKNLVKLLGGEISVKSEYGTGSEFTFNIPLHYKEERAK